ncbi:hypothetical protein FQ707_07960 [Bacteroidaceae bacterium HV4-6-C5C]|nr:hypothetical protein FQ707_07960 [Bacteroidaceae bacterium HV4-6-C5C]
MKKILFLLLACAALSSCCTLFSSSKQDITFTGMNGTKIYEASTKQKIAEIKQDNAVTVQIKKRREDRQFLAKKDGYKATPLVLESTFNNACLWNILFWPGFLIDFGTEKMNKWDNTIVNIEMEKEGIAGAN